MAVIFPIVKKCQYNYRIMKKLSIIAITIVLLMSCNQATTQDTKAKETNKPNEVLAVSPVPPTETAFTFDNYEAGKTPSGWSNYFTGKGGLGHWEILDVEGNKILAQVSKENYGYHFDVIVYDDLSCTDVEITVKFKGVEGSEDQGGGPVWRYQDADNYYIARANPLENNYRVYKVINGNRKQLKSVNMEINTGKWYTLKITMEGDEINCYFDGELKLKTSDSSFSNPGKTGLWTKADAVTYFDDFEVVTFEK